MQKFLLLEVLTLCCFTVIVYGGTLPRTPYNRCEKLPGPPCLIGCYFDFDGKRCLDCRGPCSGTTQLEKDDCQRYCTDDPSTYNMNAANTSTPSPTNGKILDYKIIVGIAVGILLLVILVYVAKRCNWPRRIGKHLRRCMQMMSSLPAKTDSKKAHLLQGCDETLKEKLEGNRDKFLGLDLATLREIFHNYHEKLSLKTYCEIFDENTDMSKTERIEMMLDKVGKSEENIKAFCQVLKEMDTSVTRQLAARLE